MFGANLVILAQICFELSYGQAKLPKILCQNGQYDLEGHGQWPPFSITSESIPWCKVQIWWFQFKIVTSYCADEVKFTDVFREFVFSCDEASCTAYLLAEGQTDRHRQRQYSFDLKGQHTLTHKQKTLTNVIEVPKLLFISPIKSFRTGRFGNYHPKYYYPNSYSQLISEHFQWNWS